MNDEQRRAELKRLKGLIAEIDAELRKEDEADKALAGAGHDGAPPTKAEEFFRAAERMMVTLYGRWQDEQKYEDIKEYQVPLDPIAARFGVTIVQMRRSPFGLDFSVDGKTYKLFISRSQYGYKRIK